MANKRWTDDDVEDLRLRVAAGQTVPTIAAELQRSQEATRARMQLLGLTKPRQFKAEQFKAVGITSQIGSDPFDAGPAPLAAAPRVSDFAEQ